jgi:dolichyl-phosphate beta-glucosyltransferase
LAEGPELSIIIPAFNEEQRLPATIAAVRAWLDRAALAAELILVDDGSADATGEIVAAAAAADPRLVPVINPVNVGKGHAIVTGVARSRGAQVVFFDADLSYDLAYIDDARRHLGDGADVVVGARDLATSDSRRDYGLSRRLASGAFNRYVDLMLGLGVPDTQCGFKAFRGDVARPLFAALTVGGFGFDVELLFVARRWGLRIDRIPVAMTARGGSSVSVVRHSLGMARDVWSIRRRGERGRYPDPPTRDR